MRAEMAKLQAELTATQASANAATASAVQSEAARVETTHNLERATVEAAEHHERRQICEEQLRTGQQHLSGAHTRIDELEGAI
eukprot:8205229-Alexandrium_andersonii.AAC.1